MYGFLPFLAPDFVFGGQRASWIRHDKTSRHRNRRDPMISLNRCRTLEAGKTSMHVFSIYYQSYTTSRS